MENSTFGASSFVGNILQNIYDVIKKYCLESVSLKKWELLEKIQGVSNLLYLKIDLIHMTSQFALLATLCFELLWSQKRIKSQIFYYIHCTMPKRVASWRGHFRIIAPWQHSFFRRNVVPVASRWQHCVRFEPETSRSIDEHVIARPTGWSQKRMTFDFFLRNKESNVR